MKKKIIIITGTRADYGLLKPVIEGMLKSSKLEPKLLVTGMHTLKKFGNTIDQIKKDKLKIEATFPISEGDDMLQSLSKEISGIAGYCSSNVVDGIFVLGDRDEAFAGAIVGSHLNIPVIHFSGGDVSGPSVDQYLRNSITIFSKFHFTQTSLSRINVIRLGADPKLSFIAGSLGLDNLNPPKMANRSEVAAKFNLKPDDKWFLVAMHPTLFEEVSIKKQIDPLVDVLKTLKGEKIIIYPNSDSGSEYFIKKINTLKGQKGVHVFRSLARDLYLELLKNCDVFCGNSSSGLVEADFLKTPFINIGNRQRDREFGSNVIFSDYDEVAIKRSLQIALSDKFKAKLKKSKPRYSGGRVAWRVITQLEKLL